MNFIKVELKKNFSVMKKIAILLVAAFALLGVNTANAQSRTSYFMEGSYFRTEFNPALVPTRGYIMIPGLSGVNLNVGTNFLSLDNFIYERDGQLVTALHSSVSTEEFIGNLPKDLKTTAAANVNLFGAGFYTKKMFWNFGANLRTDNNVVISRNLFETVKSLGNGKHDLGSTGINSNTYVEAYFGTSFPLLEWLTIGVRGKFLVGLANVNAEFQELSLNLNENFVRGNLYGEWKANCPVLDNQPLVNGQDVKVSELLNTDPNRMMQNFNNFGAAIDMGVEMRFLNNHLKVSAAVTDLGFIKWSAANHIGGKVTGGFEYTGVTVGKDGVNTDEIIRPTESNGEWVNLNESLHKGEYEGYTNRLTCSLNAGVEYNMLKNKIALGLFSQTKVLNTATASVPYTEITASVNLRPLNWVSATVSHTMLSGNNAGVFGAALNFHPALFNFYLGVDFIDTNYVNAFAGTDQFLPIPRNAKSLNVYAGMAFNFARPKHLRPEKKAPRWK